jgi:hypothetical protein
MKKIIYSDYRPVQSIALRTYLTAQNKKIGYILFDHLCSVTGIDNIITEVKTFADKLDFFIIDGTLDDYSIKFYENIQKRFEDEGIKNFIILSGNVYHYTNNNNKIFYYPMWWMQTQVQVDSFGDKIFQPKKYIFSSLNGIARLHRVLLATHILKKSYVNQCCLTFNHYGGSGSDRNNSLWDQTDKWWLDQEFYGKRGQELLNFAKEFLPYRSDEIDAYETCNYSNLNAAYSNTYVNIITETNVRQAFLTEKTFKALASGQFFISINGPGSVGLLKSFGFDVFDDIIDHSRYDDIIGPYTKIEAVSKLLDNIVNLDWPSLWALTKERRQKNVDHFFSDACKDLLKPFEQRIESI